MFSGLFFRDGRLFALPDVTDSHEDLIDLCGVTDKSDRCSFVREEFTPPKDGDILDLSKWKLRVDGECTPDWYQEERSRREWEALVRGMTLSESRKRILRGCWIVPSGIGVGTVKNIARVALCTGDIEDVYGSARIERVYRSARIERVYGSARIGGVYDSAVIGVVHDSARIEGVYDSARIERVYRSARIERVYGSARVDIDNRAVEEKTAAISRGEWGRIPSTKGRFDNV